MRMESRLLSVFSKKMSAKYSVQTCARKERSDDRVYWECSSHILKSSKKSDGYR